MDYFSDKELRCPDTHKTCFPEGFLDALNELRAEFGQVMHINSACRSKAYNERLKGHPRSLHVFDYPHHNTGGCCAVDVHSLGRVYQRELIMLALDKGWSVGQADNFVHLDMRTEFAGLPKIIWNYHR